MRAGLGWVGWGGCCGEEEGCAGWAAGLGWAGVGWGGLGCAARSASQVPCTGCWPDMAQRTSLPPDPNMVPHISQPCPSTSLSPIPPHLLGPYPPHISGRRTLPPRPQGQGWLPHFPAGRGGPDDPGLLGGGPVTGGGQLPRGSPPAQPPCFGAFSPRGNEDPPFSLEFGRF